MIPSKIILRSIAAALTLAAAVITLTPGQSLAQKRQRDRITREEILNSPHSVHDLYQAIRSLRPHFLERPAEVRTLGGAYAPGAVSVYVDGTREIGVEALRMITASNVEEVRYLDPTRSENEFGPRATGGAIAVKLYKGPKALAPARDSEKPPRR